MSWIIYLGRKWALHWVIEWVWMSWAASASVFVDGVVVDGLVVLELPVKTISRFSPVSVAVVSR